jgi:hypothetical protein
MVEKNIDCRKHRKSTHLASADLVVMESEGKPLIFTITECWYETGVNVSGTKKDGYFCKLEGQAKDFLINSGNRSIVASFAKNEGHDGADAFNIGNWTGLRIELYVDEKVKMMGEVVGGIRVRKKQPKDVVLPPFTEEQFDKAHKAKATIEGIKKHYTITPEMEQKFKDYGTKK